MKQRVARYQTKPESTETNAHLVEQVFKELDARQPKNLRYLVLRLEDDCFLHIVLDETVATAARCGKSRHFGRSKAASCSVSSVARSQLG